MSQFASKEEYLAARIAELETMLTRRCKCRFSSGGVLSQSCEFHTRLAHANADRIAALESSLAAANEKSDAEMLRVKACEHIADGDEGWERLRNECPSTAAVSRLRDRAERSASLVDAHYDARETAERALEAWQHATNCTSADTCRTLLGKLNGDLAAAHSALAVSQGYYENEKIMHHATRNALASAALAEREACETEYVWLIESIKQPAHYVKNDAVELTIDAFKAQRFSSKSAAKIFQVAWSTSNSPWITLSDFHAVEHALETAIRARTEGEKGEGNVQG